MEPSTREPPSRRRRASARTSNYPDLYSSPARSQQPLPKSGKRKSTKKKRKAEEEPFWDTKSQAILEEKVEGGVVKYLVNWADHPSTGEVYPPSWEPAEYVTDGARAQWKGQKASGRVIRKEGSAIGSYILDNNNNNNGTDSAKRKRDEEDSPLQEYVETDEEEHTVDARKRPRTHTSEERALEVQDSYPQQEDSFTPANNRRGTLAVELALPEDFDRTAYQTVQSSPPKNTQSIASQSEKSFLEVPEDPIEASSPAGAIVRPVRKGNTAAAGRFVVPDSQDVPQASASWEPSQLHSTSTTYTSLIETQPEEEQESLLVETFQQDFVHSDVDLLLIDSGGTEPSEAGFGSSVLDFGNLGPLAPLQVSAPAATQSVEPVTSLVRYNSTSPVISPIRSLLTPTRQETQAVNNFSASPSSQILRGSDHSQANSSGHSQQQLPSPSAERSRSVSVKSASTTQSASGTKGREEDPAADNGAESHLLTSVVQPSSSAVLTAQDPILPDSSPHDRIRRSRSPQQATTLRQSIELPLSSPRKRIASSLPLSPSVPTSSSNMDIDDAASQRAAVRAERRAKNEKNFEETMRTYLAGLSQTNPSAQPSTQPHMQISNSEVTPAASAVLTATHTGLQTMQATSQSPGAPQPEPLPAASLMSDSVGLKADDNVQQQREATDSEIVPEIEQLELERSQAENTLDVVPHTINEFFVALPFNAGCREFYHQTLRTTKHERQALLHISGDATEALEENEVEVVERLEGMISTLELLCSHPDLASDDYSTQRADTYITQAKFAENRSTKCIFIAELVHKMRLQRRRVAIIVRPGRMLEILDAVLTYHHFKIQTGTPYEYRHEAGLTVYLLPSDSTPESLQVPCADLVIAFDNTFAHQQVFNGLRARSDSLLSPLVHLVVFQSVEHLQLLFPATLPPLDRLCKIAGCLSLIQDDVGKIDADPGNTANEITMFIENGTAWSCQDLPLVEDAQGFVDDLRSSASPVMTHRSLQASSVSATPVPIGAKRQLEDDDDMQVDSPKRQRLTPALEEIDADASVVNLPNSMILGAYTPMQNASNLSNGTCGPIGPDPTDGTEARFEAENFKLRQQLQEKEGFEADLLRLNKELQAQLVDLQASVKSIQPKYQEALNERAESNHKETLAIAAMQVMQKNLDTRQSEIASLKEQNVALTTQLGENREIMSKSQVPDIAKLASLEEQVRTLTAENQKLDKQKQSADNDTNYARDQYRAASNAAAESAARALELEAEINTLRAAASGEKAQIHEIQRDQDKQALTRMVKQLRLEKVELQRELEKKALELGALTNGRRSTRGTSTPMSPRVMSPGGGIVNNARGGNLSRILQQQQARSRGNSPSVTDRAYVSGSAVFGDLLPPPNRIGDTVRRG